MSTLKSSAENLTLNADGSGNDIKFQSNASEVAEITDGGVISSTGGSTHADNVKAKFGTGDDLEIYHDGTRNYIDSKSSQLRVETDALRLRSDGGETYLEADVDGSVQIYWDNNKKLETTSGGVTVTGDATITSGDIVFSTAGKGICLGVTSNTDANTLSDYEEGTWTPVFSGEDTVGTYSYSVQVGYYTKIGNMVTLWFSLFNITTASAGVGSIRITGVPFSVHASPHRGAVGTLELDNFTFSGSLSTTVESGMTYITPRQSISGSADVRLQCSGRDNDGADFCGSITYMEA